MARFQGSSLGKDRCVSNGTVTLGDFGDPTKLFDHRQHAYGIRRLTSRPHLLGITALELCPFGLHQGIANRLRRRGHRQLRGGR